MPTLSLFRNHRRGFEHNPNRKQIIDLLERYLLTLHLRPNRINRFDPSRNFKIDAILLQCLDQRSIELFNEFGSIWLRLLNFLLDLPVLFGETIFERQILQLTLDRIQPQTMSQRSKQIDRLAGDLHLFVWRHTAQCTHIVQTVRNLNQNHPNII